MINKVFKNIMNKKNIKQIKKKNKIMTHLKLMSEFIFLI